VALPKLLQASLPEEMLFPLWRKWASGILQLLVSGFVFLANFAILRSKSLKDKDLLNREAGCGPGGSGEIRRLHSRSLYKLRDGVGQSERGEAEHFREGGAGAEGEDFGFAIGDEDGVLEVGGGFAVFGDDGPAVFEDADGGDAGVDHRLDGEGHAGHEGGGFAAGTEVGDLGFLVEAAADAVADEFADDGEASGFDEFLDGAAEVGEFAAGAGPVDGLVEGLLGDGEEAFGFVGNFASGDGGGVVADEAAFDDADVDLDDVSGLDAAGAADAVDDFLVDGDADLAGEAAVAEKGAFAVVLAHELGGEFVDFAGGFSG